MEFYLAPEEPQTDFLRVHSPEELKVCDPACGTGHILTYAFDLLYEIYAEEGYAPAEIPALILKNNLYGLELDLRAAQLAQFALTVKACEKRGDCLLEKYPVNICGISPVHVEKTALREYARATGIEEFTEAELTALRLFKEADNFGSLLQPPTAEIMSISRKTAGVNPDALPSAALRGLHERLLNFLRMATMLSDRYHAVIANPPYMGLKFMNDRLSAWVKENYPDSRADLFAAFMERNLTLTLPGGHLGFMTPMVWMFISSYEKLRKRLITRHTITTLVQPEKSSFDGAAVAVCLFTVENAVRSRLRGAYIYLADFKGGDQQAARTQYAARHHDCGYFYRAKAYEFLSVPGATIAYRLPPNERARFNKNAPLCSVADARQGLASSDNNRFLRLWHEVDRNRIGFGMRSHREAAQSGKKWFPINKGGGYRKWYGNQDYVINWENNGAEVMAYAAALYGSPTRTIKSISKYFLPSVSWNKIAAGHHAFRYYPAGFLFETAGQCAFGGDEAWKRSLLSYCNGGFAQAMTQAITSTIAFQVGDFCKLPYPEQFWGAESAVSAERLIDIAREDWNSYETSWDFTDLPLLRPEFRRSTLADSYAALRANRQEMTDETAALEEANNRRFNALYGLGDEFPVTVPPQLITLTCNPAYRYGGDKSAPEQEALMLADTMRELISYAVGCMFGRFSCAETAETDGFYVADNVLPIQNEDWFANDMAARFKTFLIATFSAEKIEENIRFIEQALNVKNRRHYTLRDYFNNEFYADHVKRYSKRPIYWLFSSAKGGFKALIYLHRYRPDTVDVILNDYLRPLRLKLAARRERMENAPLTAADRKRLDQLIRLQNELAAYETDVLFPLAQNKVELDLDNGVRVNYLKLGAALKPLE